MKALTEDSITFGRYKGKTVNDMLRDREYCTWFLKQEEFRERYEYIYNRVKIHKPRSLFLPEIKQETKTDTVENFIASFYIFNLPAVNKVELSKDTDRTCYSFYLTVIEDIKQRLLNCPYKNFFEIKAPNNWLKKFENEHKLDRIVFKDFLTAHELPNIPSVIEEMKACGGLVYKGAKSFLIAKERSLKQERYWSDLLKEKYGDKITLQHKIDECIYDALDIPNNILYECKLNLKDFNEKQHEKYKKAREKYRFVYLIDFDCIIDITNSVIYTDNTEKYQDQIIKGKTGNFPVSLDTFVFRPYSEYT